MATEPPQPQLNTSEEFATETLSVGWPWRLMIFSVVILAFTVFVYLGLHFGYSTYLDSRLQTYQKSLDDLANRVGADKQQQFVSIYSQLVNLKTVLDQHGYTVNALQFLESNVVQTVYFTEAAFVGANETLSVKGVTNSFDSLAAQVGTFEKAQGVKSALLSDVNIQSGNIGFTVDIAFDPSFFTNLLP